ncbi:hypothetical protein JMN32_14830 [Fulvivirga sp. 29W222]|uniref:Secreted protein n=1 Tax=Fulvivirga marina TaxID=2494733 RepID=A0A937FZY7_9BACT|nr:hypothetical protein [Fulvivirga marina]MBL6447591.1 hypothetical protein [Fulvivirga marina]
MKSRTLLTIAVVTFSGLVFSACTDEAENIIPQPVNTDEAAATIGDGTKDADRD